MGDPLFDDGREVLADPDFRFEDPPMIPLRKLRSPDSRSLSVNSLSTDCRDTGRKSLSESCELTDGRLEFAHADSKGVAGDGGITPLNARKEPPGAICVSVRMMSNRRPGAGLLGAVEGGKACLRSASSLAKRKNDHSLRSNSNNRSYI